MLSSSARKQETVTAFEEAQVVATAIAATRDWVNIPPGDLDARRCSRTPSTRP